MKKAATLFVTAAFAALTAVAADPAVKISVLENSVLYVHADNLPENITDQIQAASVPSHLAGTVLDLRFADGAATNSSDYFLQHKSPLILLVNSQTRGQALILATLLRADAHALIIGSTNLPGTLAPDIIVGESANDELKFQDDPFFNSPAAAPVILSGTNLLAFVDHTSEAELVRKRIKDGEETGDAITPRADPLQPVIRDPALARAMDLFKALAIFHPVHGA